MKMQKIFKPLILVCLFSLILLSSECQVPVNKLVPALYIFGDSNVDAGNNNVLKTTIRGNVKPYGIDFPGGLSADTGRMTNGFTFVDFFSKWLELQLAPAINLVDLNKTENTDGFNYASSSSGVFEETIFGDNENICFGKQLRMFKDTIENYLSKRFEDKTELSNYLSKSIFVVSVGVNDFVMGLNMKVIPGVPLTLNLYTPFTELILNRLGDYIEELHNLGARKFLVNELFPLGNSPMSYLRVNKSSQEIDIGENEEVSYYNSRLASEIETWTRRLDGSSFVIMKSFDILNDMMINSTRYGITETRKPCCELDAKLSCDATKEPCKDRSHYLYFDPSHVTEAAHKILAKECFYGEKVCFPMNLKAFAQK